MIKCIKTYSVKNSWANPQREIGRWRVALVATCMLMTVVGCTMEMELQASSTDLDTAIEVGMVEQALEGYSVATDASSYYTNAPVTVFWQAPSGHATNDWVAIHAAGAPNTSYVSWRYVPAGTSGSLAFTAPSTPGTYEVRYLLNGGYTSAAVSSQFSVTLAPPPGYYICRGLGQGDPYYPSWIHCCDNSDRTQSYWINSSGSGGWYSGSCYSWGIR